MGSDPKIPSWLQKGRENITAFERSELHENLRTDRRDWWTQIFEKDGEVLLRQIENLLTQAQLAPSGCVIVNAKTPKRLTWKGRRQYAYQMVCVGLGGVLPAESDVVRHICNNRQCVNPDHLRLGTQRENIQDERARRYQGQWG